jgi:O-antigen/teichoic acid export membrane protein
MHKTTTHRVKQSMVSTLIMRPISAIGGFLILVLLSRLLSVTDYGNYFAIWAIVEILILGSNFGLIHGVYRYVHAKESFDGVILPQGPVWHLVGWRFASLALTGLFVMAVSNSLLWLFNEFMFPDQLMIYLVWIVFFEGMARFFEVVFDSMLCQGRSQISLVSRTLFRLAGYLVFLSQDLLDLQHVLYAELVATILGFLLAAAMLWDISNKSKRFGHAEDRQIIGFSRAASFALPAFAAQVLTLVYGPDALKLALSHTSGTAELALFGFSYSIAGVIQRYLPANLLGGIFRPIFVAGSKKPDAEAILSELLSISIKINWMVILPIFCFLFFGGTPILANMSGGNYLDAGRIIAIIMIGLLALSMHLTFSMYCLAQETSWPTFIATAISTVGLPLGIALGEHYGAVGIAITLGSSELIWVTTCFAILRHSCKETLKLDWLGLAKLLCATAVAVLICFLLKVATDGWWLTFAIIAPLMFIVNVYFLKVISMQEKAWLISVLPVRKSFKLIRPL